MTMTGEEFRSARLKLELTQEELGKLLGMSGRSVIRREAGDVEVSPSEAAHMTLLVMHEERKQGA